MEHSSHPRGCEKGEIRVSTSVIVRNISVQEEGEEMLQFANYKP